MVATRDHSDRATHSVVLALPNSAVQNAAADRLQRAGWRVYRAATIASLRRLACRLAPEVIVMSVDGSDESGWLTCAKLLRGAPRMRVIVVGETTAKERALARFIGAEALLPLSLIHI